MTYPAFLFPLGPLELVVILVVLVLLFGATRIPQLGRAVGEGIRNFKDGIRDAKADPSEDATKGGPKSSS